MLSTGQIAAQQVEVIRVLNADGRKGMDNMINYLVNSDFFHAPASTRYHGCYEGGLAKHSLSVKANLIQLCTAVSLPLPEGQSAVEVTTVLHDVCKIGCYQPTLKADSKQKYSWKYGSPPGHALLSLTRIMQFIALSEMEEAMIRYHMGIYGSKECMSEKGEFVMRPDGMFKAYNKYPLVKFIYFADEMAAAQERAEEGIK